MIFWLWLVPAAVLGALVGFYFGWQEHKRWLDLIYRHYNLHTFDFAPGPSCPTAFPGPEIVTPVSYPQCSYDGCKADTGSSWDDRCVNHSLHKDGGRP